MDFYLYIVVGLFAGIFSGFFGVGGGVVMIPALGLFFGMSQHQAQGTVLATMIPPIGLLAAIKYYYAGNVNIRIAAFMCLGFFFGGLVGAYGAHMISTTLLRRIFGVLLFAISLRLIIAG